MSQHQSSQVGGLLASLLRNPYARSGLAESFNGLYKWELIHRQGPWRGLDDVEFATMTYVEWFNHRRLHGHITPGPDYTTPAEFEAAYYDQTQPAPKAVTQ